MAKTRVNSLRTLPPDRDIDDTTSVLGLLTSRVKLKILYALATGECNAGDLSITVGERLPVISRHTGVLRIAKLIDYEKHGNFVRYRLTDLGRAAVSGAESIRACKS